MVAQRQLTWINYPCLKCVVGTQYKRIKEKGPRAYKMHVKASKMPRYQRVFTGSEQPQIEFMKGNIHKIGNRHAE